MTDEEKPVSKTILKAADKYIARIECGEKIMRDACGRLQWASGRPVGRKTIEYMIDRGILHALDTDLFGDSDRGQTLGLRHG